MHRYAHVAMIRRPGLWGERYNVRESRSEGPDGALPRALGEGRTLSWRWLPLADAEALLERTTARLEGLGYVAIDRSDAHRGPWDWLHRLVHRSLEPAPAASSGGGDALGHALNGLGLREDEILEGVAEVLGVHAVRVEHPDPSAAHDVAPETLHALLPFLLAHANPRIAAVGERWLALPAVAYDVDPDALCTAISAKDALGQAVLPRLRDEGLALLGPERLTTLFESTDEDVRHAVSRWRHRLSPTLEA